MPTVNRKAPDKTHTQSAVFSKAKFDADQARAWCQDHDLTTNGFHETEQSYRFRQYDPDYTRFRYRSKTPKAGVTLVIGYPK